MLRLHLQPKLQNKLATHNWTRGKIVILLKYVENTRWRENYIKLELKNGFKAIKLRGSSLFIDTMGNS